MVWRAGAPQNSTDCLSGAMWVSEDVGDSCALRVDRRPCLINLSRSYFPHLEMRSQCGG